jgi:DNA relaxase NicK
MSKILTAHEEMRNFWAEKSLKDLEQFRADAPQVSTRAPLLIGALPPSPVDNFAVEDLQRTKLDWLGFTVGQPYSALVSWCQCIFPGATVTPNPGGVKGYPKSAGVYVAGEHIGTMGYDADHGKNMVNITGQGCRRLKAEDYLLIVESLEAMNWNEHGQLAERDRVKLIRVDLALDFFKGEVTWDDASQAFDDGAFQVENSVTDVTRTDIGSRRGSQSFGRTLNVGMRSSCKMARIYEKGLEIFAKMPKEYQDKIEVPDLAIWGEREYAPDGTKAADWLRVEVEFKPADVSVLGLDMITDRDAYFAGAYPFCAMVLEVGDGKRPERLKPEAVVSLDRKTQACRNSYGSLIETYCDLGFTDSEIVALLRNGMPDTKLIKAGVIDAIKSDPAWKVAMLAEREIPF